MPKYIKSMKQWIIWGGEMPGGGVRLLASDTVQNTDFTVTTYDLDELRVQMFTTIEVRGKTFEECLATLFKTYKDQGDTWKPPPESEIPAIKELEE